MIRQILSLVCYVLGVGFLLYVAVTSDAQDTRRIALGIAWLAISVSLREEVDRE